MKKAIFGLWIAALLLLGAGALAEADFTLLAYMCGADLQSDACEDIYEMGIAENGDDVNIVVLAGGTTEWDFDELSGNTRNLVTIRDGAFETIEDWGWASMGSEESLLEFLDIPFVGSPASVCHRSWNKDALHSSLSKYRALTGEDPIASWPQGV